MAGFAVVMETLFLLILGSITALIAALIGRLLARKRVRNAGLESHPLTSMCIAAPFHAMAWAIVTVFLYAQLCNHFAHQSCGFSPDPYVTLPNGYVFGSMNTYDGYVRAPDAQTDVPVTGPGYVRSVITIDFEDGRFTGTLFDFKTSAQQHFVLDTRDQSIQISPVGPMSWQSGQTEAHAGSDSYWIFYKQYRHSWPFYVWVALLVAGWSAIALKVWKLWQSLELVPHDRIV